MSCATGSEERHIEKEVDFYIADDAARSLTSIDLNSLYNDRHNPPKEFSNYTFRHRLLEARPITTAPGSTPWDTTARIVEAHSIKKDLCDSDDSLSAGTATWSGFGAPSRVEVVTQTARDKYRILPAGSPNRSCGRDTFYEYDKRQPGTDLRRIDNYNVPQFFFTYYLNPSGQWQRSISQSLPIRYNLDYASMAPNETRILSEKTTRFNIGAVSGFAICNDSLSIKVEAQRVDARPQFPVSSNFGSVQTWAPGGSGPFAAARLSETTAIVFPDGINAPDCSVFHSAELIRKDSSGREMVIKRIDASDPDLKNGFVLDTTLTASIRDAEYAMRLHFVLTSQASTQTISTPWAAITAPWMDGSRVIVDHFPMPGAPTRIRVEMDTVAGPAPTPPKPIGRLERLFSWMKSQNTAVRSVTNTLSATNTTTQTVKFMRADDDGSLGFRSASVAHQTYAATQAIQGTIGPVINLSSPRTHAASVTVFEAYAAHMEDPNPTGGNLTSGEAMGYAGTAIEQGLWILLGDAAKLSDDQLTRIFQIFPTLATELGPDETGDTMELGQCIYEGANFRFECQPQENSAVLKLQIPAPSSLLADELVKLYFDPNEVGSGLFYDARWRSWAQENLKCNGNALTVNFAEPHPLRNNANLIKLAQGLATCRLNDLVAYNSQPGITLFMQGTTILGDWLPAFDLILVQQDIVPYLVSSGVTEFAIPPKEVTAAWQIAIDAYQMFFSEVNGIDFMLAESITHPMSELANQTKTAQGAPVDWSGNCPLGEVDVRRENTPEDNSKINIYLREAQQHYLTGRSLRNQASENVLLDLEQFNSIDDQPRIKFVDTRTSTTEAVFMSNFITPEDVIDLTDFGIPTQQAIDNLKLNFRIYLDNKFCIAHSARGGPTLFHEGVHLRHHLHDLADSTMLNAYRAINQLTLQDVFVTRNKKMEMRKVLLKKSLLWGENHAYRAALCMGSQEDYVANNCGNHKSFMEIHLRPYLADLTSICSNPCTSTSDLKWLPYVTYPDGSEEDLCSIFVDPKTILKNDPNRPTMAITQGNNVGGPAVVTVTHDGCPNVP